MPKPRQFVQMMPGDVLGTGAQGERWDVAASGSPSGFIYYCRDNLDLRALLSGKEPGIQMTSFILQEAGPWAATISGDRGYFMVIDLVTTQRPTEEFLIELWEQPALPGRQAGFLIPDNALAADKSPDDQDFNPSQVEWGFWRLWGITDTNALGPSTLALSVNQSGYFGTGEVAVAPGLHWTRVIVPYQDGDIITIPSANLVSQGVAVDMTVPQEISSMMRAVQR